MGLIEKSNQLGFNLVLKSFLFLVFMYDSIHNVIMVQVQKPWWQTVPCCWTWWLKHPARRVSSPQTHTLITAQIWSSFFTHKPVPAQAITTAHILFCSYECGSLLTERVDVFPDSEGEAAASIVNAEEDHSHVLRGAHSSPQWSRVTVIHIALVQRQRVILRAGELFSFHHPAVKHLYRTH